MGPLKPCGEVVTGMAARPAVCSDCANSVIGKHQPFVSVREVCSSFRDDPTAGWSWWCGASAVLLAVELRLDQ